VTVKGSVSTETLPLQNLIQHIFIMTVENATAFLQKMDADHNSPESVLVAHGAALGHEFNESELLDAAGGGDINVFSGNKVKIKWTKYF
jgi:hypothetical protein